MMGSGQKRQKTHNTQHTSQLLGSCYGPIQLGAGWGRPAIMITVTVIVALALFTGKPLLQVAEVQA